MQDIQEIKNEIVFSLLVLGIIIILICLIGLLGICKKNGCCLTIYNILNILMAVIMTALALVFLIYFKKYDPEMKA